MLEAAQTDKEIFEKTMPFIKFYGNCLKCYMGAVAGALAGGGPAPVQPTGAQKLLPGNQKQFVGCMISAICTFKDDLVSQLAGDMATAPEAAFDVEELNTLEQVVHKLELTLFEKGAGAAVDAEGKSANKACQAGMNQAMK